MSTLVYREGGRGRKIAIFCLRRMWTTPKEEFHLLNYILSIMTEKEKNQNDGKFDIKLKKLKKMNQQRMSTSQEAIDDYYSGAQKKIKMTQFMK